MTDAEFQEILADLEADELELEDYELATLELEREAPAPKPAVPTPAPQRPASTPAPRPAPKLPVPMGLQSDGTWRVTSQQLRDPAFCFSASSQEARAAASKIEIVPAAQ
jgi:hypothetical protein